MNKSKLEELFGVTLHDAHDNWKCICPFHDEHTPSFFIHKTDLICHCFGCGVSGYIDFMVARKCDIPVPKARQLLELKIIPGMLGQNGPHRQREKPKTFPVTWLAPWKKLKAHPFFEKRELSSTIAQGLGARYDGRTGRIVFPLFHQGQLYGAAGRATDGTDPKWYFYWGCNKSSHVYKPWPFTEGFPEEACIPPVVVVEGIFDLMKVVQSGHREVVALMGSKPSDEQIKEIKQLSDEVIIALDNDQAGKIGSEMLGNKLKGSMVVKYASLPDFANDLGDLSTEQVRDVLNTPLTRIEKTVNVSSK